MAKVLDDKLSIPAFVKGEPGMFLLVARIVDFWGGVHYIVRKGRKEYTVLARNVKLGR